MDLRALQGCEARRSKRQKKKKIQKKSPSAFGLVSASRKPSATLHVCYPEVSPLQENFRHFLFLSRLGDAGMRADSAAYQRSLQLTCGCVSCAIGLICGNSPPTPPPPPDVASCGSHATHKLTNLSVFGGGGGRGNMSI